MKAMSVMGTVKDGVIVLPAGTQLPEGAQVCIEIPESSLEDDELAAAMLRLAKPRAHLPADYALNHGHYNRGEPKQ